MDAVSIDEDAVPGIVEEREREVIVRVETDLDSDHVVVIEDLDGPVVDDDVVFADREPGGVDGSGFQVVDRDVVRQQTPDQRDVQLSVCGVQVDGL